MVQIELPPSFPPSFAPLAPRHVSGKPATPAGRAGVRRRRRTRRRWTWAVLTAALLVLATGLVAVGWVQGLPVSIIGVTSTGEPIPQATGLNPQIEAAFARAQADAAHEGIALTLTSGWRSAAEQEQLVRDYIQRYGSVQEAHRLVLPPSRSAHVQGNAIDVGDAMGASWLDEHGSAYGLCRTYANETWHFEQVIEPGGSCPPMKPDASHGWQ